MNSFFRKFDNGVLLEYDIGKFDDWCVFKTNEYGFRRAPLDIDYFTQLYNFGTKYGFDKVYNDFVELYNNTTKDINFNINKIVDKIAQKYDEFQDMQELLTILYMTMVAEENKAYTRLGKRIKRLGVYTLLIEKKDLQYSVNFMKGMSWRQIDKMCQDRGF